MKTYLGDSVYADTDGYHIILTTNNGGVDSNTIFLELQVLLNLLRYTEKIHNLKIKIEEVKGE